MASSNRAYRKNSCNGPVPSQRQDTNILVDFFAKPEVPKFVDDLCGKETVLDTSISPFIPNGNGPIACKITINDEKENTSGYCSFLSQKSDDSSEVDSSQKKLVATPDTSYIDMNLSDKIKPKPSNDKKENSGCFCVKHISNGVVAATDFMRAHKKVIKFILKVSLTLGLTVYMLVALAINFHRALPLLVIWCLVFIFKTYAICANLLGPRIRHKCLPFETFLSGKKRYINGIVISLAVIGLLVWIALDTAQRPHQLISLGGYLFFIFCLFITSKYPNKVIWRPVVWGLTIQFCVGLIILRTQAGFVAFNWVGHFAQVFIEFVSDGVDFVFGNVDDHYVAFKVLPIVLYFSAFISVMYYLGAMQWLILKIAWLMQITLGTSATESMVAAGNIFVGLTESPLLIRPYIDDLTTSELHAVMTAGFGTIAGSVMGAYLGLGIQPVYVITACVMAAPCALAVSKLVYPETKKSKFNTTDGLVLEKTEQNNVIEAAFVGASQAISLVLNIGANLIAFLSLLAAINGFLGWFGSLVNFEGLSFQLVCSYLFMPMTFLMGVEWKDCFKAAELIGMKIFLNEFIAYDALATTIKARDNGTIPRIDPLSGDIQWIDERSEAIVTYALCGFANIGSLGIMLGGLGSMAPKRQGEMARIVVRALVSGIFVSILNACIAGFLYVPRPIDCTHMLNTTNWTYTDPMRLHTCCLEAVTSNETFACNCCTLYNWNATGYSLPCSSDIC